jgi:hypothetical protein
MIAFYQAHHAPTAALRATYAQIAADELRHAEVAREIEAWTNKRLCAAARKRVHKERQGAIADLARSVRRRPATALVRELGMPDLGTARQLFSSARAELWA